MNYYLKQLLIDDILDIIPIVVNNYAHEVGINDFDDLERTFEEIFSIKARRRKYLMTGLLKASHEYDEGLTAIIKGRKGSGKSTYTMKSTAQFYLEYIENAGEAYFEALKRMAHTPHEFRLGIHRYRDTLILDDAGVWFSTYFWYDPEMRDYLIWFLNWYDTSRTSIHNLIFTTLSPKKLPPRVRDDIESVHARIRRVGSKYIDGKMFKVSSAHLVLFDESDYSTKVLRQDLGEDMFIVKLPDPIYKIYWIIRKSYDILAEQKLTQILTQKGLLGSNIPGIYIEGDQDESRGIP